MKKPADNAGLVPPSPEKKTGTKQGLAATSRQFRRSVRYVRLRKISTLCDPNEQTQELYREHERSRTHSRILLIISADICEQQIS